MWFYLSKNRGPILLAGILLIGALLRFYQLGASSIGNEYYAATVKSMLISWHNFFFVAFEPGASVSVDKPPLGFWIEALSAAIFGVNGFALAFPNALAGLFSIPVLYILVKKQFGELAGLTAGLVLAVTPITIAAERNNTVDGLLVFVLLLATWAVWNSVERGRLHFLLLGALLVGLGFNIKMLQALMVLPALYALQLFGSKFSLMKRLTHLCLASGLLLVVSLSWALAVDAVPEKNRPFIGSSTNNSVMELIFGHNGLKRLSAGPGPSAAGQGPQAAVDPSTNPPTQPGLAFLFSAPASPAQSPQSRPGQAGNPGGPNEVGRAGPLRLFTEPLASQISWLLPLAMGGLGLAFFQRRQAGLTPQQSLGLILWTGWLLPMLFYFSFTGGLWHTYYLIMVGPALAALTGFSLAACAHLLDNPNKTGMAGHARQILIGLSGATVLFALFILSSYPAFFKSVAPCIILIWLAAAWLIWQQPSRNHLGLLLLSMLIGPIIWSAQVSLSRHPEVNLPKAGPQNRGPDAQGANDSIGFIPKKVVDYLLANTHPQDYLVATVESHSASPLILATGRAVFTFGGFRGDDEIVNVDQLQQLVSDGTLRFILDDDRLSSKAAINSWVTGYCQKITIPGVESSLPSTTSDSQNGPREQKFNALYDCKRQ